MDGASLVTLAYTLIVFLMQSSESFYFGSLMVPSLMFWMSAMALSNTRFSNSTTRSVSASLTAIPFVP